MKKESFRASLYIQVERMKREGFLAEAQAFEMLLSGWVYFAVCISAFLVGLVIGFGLPHFPPLRF